MAYRVDGHIGVITKWSSDRVDNIVTWFSLAQLMLIIIAMPIILWMMNK